jgi:hypothetical protein
MKLGERLVQLGMLTPEQVKSVLSDRNGACGKLGTQLVERGLLDADQVSEALGRQMRLPAALQRHFDKADPNVVSLLKPNLAARYMAIPLVAARSGTKRIVVAMATPQDVLVVDDVSFALGARVEPMIACELAIVRNLKRYYNLEVKPSRAVKTESATAEPGTTLSREIPSLAGTAQLSVAGMTGTTGISDGPAVTAVSLEDAIHRLSVCEHREQIADILLDFMLPSFGCALILLVRGPRTHVWRGYAPSVDARAVETIAFPTSMPSMFRTAKDRAVSFRGTPPEEGAHLHQQIWKYLRCPPPADVLVIPVAIGQRVVTIIYAHGSGGVRMPDVAVQELRALSAAVGSTFIRLIQRAREAQR